MERILHFKEVESATIKITCGEKSGTAFFIHTNSSEQILLTSDHTLSSSDSNIIYIDIQNNDQMITEIVERIPDKDIAILRISEKPIETNELPLSPVKIAYNDEWETYGFPTQRILSGGKFNGKVSRINKGTKWDVDLECEQYNNLESFEGLSGAPLIIGGCVAGVIGYDLTGTLGATSIKSISEALKKYGINLIEDKGNSIPISIEEDIATTTPNTEVFERINEVIEQQKDSNYFLISGNPGSGKTTIAAKLEFDNKNNIICDRYFVKVPEEEDIPTQIRATPEYFIRWVEEVYCRVLFNAPPVKSNKPLSDKILDIHQGLRQLSAHYQQQNKIGFLVIDGLDDVTRVIIENFLFALPTTLPSNLKVIFSCTSKEILPTNLQSIIGSSDEIKVTPLTIQKAEQYLSGHLESKSLTLSQITELAHKSEGHPLYLRYLTKFVLGLKDNGLLDEWINSIPVIGGEIEKYYNKIWGQLNNSINEIWLAATLSRLRQPIEKETLYELLPETSKYAFITTFDKIRHLLKDDEKLSIYHTSFSDFVNSKTTTIGNDIHDNIASYCLSHEERVFAISEKVYHLSNGGNENVQKALEECNQEWVDKCATHSVNPDIVLADIRKIIGLASEYGIAHKVISLLLLSQRVNFRYNTLFNENTTYLVNALLALDKADEAIRYVVRNKTLMVSDEDALYLLQRFYEHEADEEAEELLNAINKVCRNILDKGLDRDSFNRYIRLKFSAVTLSSNSNFEETYHEFNHIKKVTIKMIKQSGNSDDAVHKFKDDIGSYNIGYFIWGFNLPPTTKLTEEKLNFNFNNKTSGFIALCIYQALEFENKSLKLKNKNNIAEWIEDLEYVIDKYGIHSDYFFFLLYILIGRSKRIDIIEKLFKKEFAGPHEFNFRKDNGVDLNHHEIHRYTLYAECLGFCDTTDQYPNISNFAYSEWENNTKRVIEYLCFLSGKVKRLIAEGKDNQVEQLKNKFVNLLNCLIPNLRDRMQWKRSYALPELIFPVIYTRLITLMNDFFPDHIPSFVQSIASKEHYQLGLYTEGYVDSLLTISRKLSKHASQHIYAFKVAKVLEEYVLITVENRWERNEYLLRLVELYAQLKNEDKVNEIFKEMINTSMGPSWYKEDQLGIINTAVSNILPKNGNLSYLQKFAAHLHQASGEMTFQRYVKQQQEEFVGDLARVGFLKKAIDYFKYLLFPNYKTIIQNAESGVVDMPYKGEGYVLGARAIEEQSGVLNLLSNINCGSSMIAWGLTELFIPGDDRYMRGFAKVQAKILNQSEINEPDKLDSLFKRLSRFVITEVDDEFRFEYLRELFSELSSTNFEKIQSYLADVGMQPIAHQKEENNKTTQSLKNEKNHPLDKLIIAKDDAQSKLDTENKSGARKVIVEALGKIQKDKYGIWSSNYSHKIDELRNLLSGSYTTSKELIKDIKELIINEPYFEEWVIADKLIRLLRNINDEDEKQQILSAVLEHIELMVRTTKGVINSYDWISLNEDNTKNQDETLLDFLLWFLNHPSLIVKNRTIEIVTWLGTSIPEVTIPILIQEILSEGYKISKELSASVLHQLSDLDPTKFWNEFKKCLEKESERLLSINHFMIRNSIIQALECVQQNGIDDTSGWLNQFKQRFSTKRNGKGEVILDEEYLEPVNDYLYELNELEILTKQFCINFLAL